MINPLVNEPDLLQFERYARTFSLLGDTNVLRVLQSIHRGSGRELSEIETKAGVNWDNARKAISVLVLAGFIIAEPGKTDTGIDDYYINPRAPEFFLRLLDFLFPPQVSEVWQEHRLGACFAAEHAQGEGWKTTRVLPIDTENTCAYLVHMQKGESLTISLVAWYEGSYHIKASSSKDVKS